jgi:hypothetical protein
MINGFAKFAEPSGLKSPAKMSALLFPRDFTSLRFFANVSDVVHSSVFLLMLVDWIDSSIPLFSTSPSLPIRVGNPVEGEMLLVRMRSWVFLT